MKLEDLSISRQGKLVVINHQKYQIEYNLTKGTWNYSDNNGKSIIKNGFTHISLSDGTNLKTLNPGFREFRTEPVNTDAYGAYQTLHFIYETTSRDELPQESKTDNSKDNSNQIEKPSKSESSGNSSTEKSIDPDEAINTSDIRVHTYLTCYANHPYVLLKVEVENRNKAPICLANITLIDISAQHGAIQLDSHPSQYHLFLRIPPISPNSTARHKIYDGFHFNRDNTVQPCQDGILHDTVSKKSLLFGFITTNKWWPRMQIGYQVSKRKSQQGLTSWSLYNDCENSECPSGNVVSSEIGYLDFSDEAESAYTRYTKRLAGVENTSIKNDTDIISKTPYDINNKVDVGWSFSEVNMQERVSAQTLKKEVESISQNPLFDPTLVGGIDYIHIESGWQQHPGNLTLNRDSFPEGMSSVVDMIHKNGYKAGIRIDPFAIETNSNFIKRNPDACLRYKASGSSESESQVVADKPIEVHLPWKENALSILDVSNPKTQKHVQKIIKRIANEWEFDIIKVDLSSYTSGLMTVASNATWYDKSLSSTELYRCALKLLKDSVESIENNVKLAGYNVIDSISIGSFPLNYPQLRQKSIDHSDNWHQQKGIKHRLCRYSGYLSDFGVLWNHVYGELVIDEPRPVNESIVELTAAAMSGASVQCANTPNQISKHRAELMAKIFPLIGQAAKVVDVFDEILPRIWHLPIETERESWELIGIFNWKDQQEDLQLNLDEIGLNPGKDYLVHDFWMRHYLGVVSKHVTLLNMAPRSAKLLCFREQQQTPQILSTDMHYTQGRVEIISAGWDEHSQSYLIICQPPRKVESSVFIHVPEDYIPTSVSAYGSEYKYNWNKPIYTLTFGETDLLIHASIQFMKTEGGSK